VPGLSSAFPPTRPESIMKRIHLDMSATLDQMEPAALTWSTLAFSITRTVPFTRSCGEATLGWPLVPASVGTLPRMSSGTKMRVRMNSSHGMPLAAATTAPAVAYITFW
jgi:hypothetical protein